jgi:transposase InsO family protein
MVTKNKIATAYEQGLFRYGIISELLSRPPERGELAMRLREISGKYFIQPWNNKSINISVRTLERWYSAAKKNERPSEILQPRLRIDRGEYRALSNEHISWLKNFHLKYPTWSIQLMYDNIVLVPFKTKIPSYSTVLRHFHKLGFFSIRSHGKKNKGREVRSFEVEYVGQMWHMDFHKGSRMIVDENGEYKQPICMAIIDDKSRLVCHAQWFLNETAEVLVHGFVQAIQKRGIPRTFYSDNGSAMKAEEFKSGLLALNIKQENTLPYSPYMNGKQESFWQPLEGRLMKMLPKYKRLTLDILNAVTQAWIEQDYHVKIHSEINEKPLDRFLNSTNVLRVSPTYEELKRSFRMVIRRALRKTDSTITIDGIRFQIPQCYIHMNSILLRYARWDLGEAEIICPDTQKSLCFIFPLNKLANSYASRKEIEEKLITQEVLSPEEDEYLDLDTHQLPPLLAHCLKKHAEQYPLSGYIPLSTNKDTK